MNRISILLNEASDFKRTVLGQVNSVADGGVYKLV